MVLHSPVKYFANEHNLARNGILPRFYSSKASADLDIYATIFACWYNVITAVKSYRATILDFFFLFEPVLKLTSCRLVYLCFSGCQVYSDLKS